jgi:formamidopyrimidine-DNA glycosylase
MPELPEVEAVRRTYERALVEALLVEVVATDDSIVFVGGPEPVAERLRGARLKGMGRRGKTFWFDLGERGFVGGHLGMSGWAREIGVGEKRLHGHGNAPLDDENGPRFLKLGLTGDNGRTVALTDGRRLGRIWLSDGPGRDAKIDQLGPDAWLETPSVESVLGWFARKKAPIKAALLDQSLFAGVGNWVADEVCYHARLNPARICQSLTEVEVVALIKALRDVLDLAVEVEADDSRYPAGWLFAHRWGGKRGSQEIDGHAIVRDTVAGRTTAWVPELQR